jgi:hypothetical protein
MENSELLGKRPGQAASRELDDNKVWKYGAPKISSRYVAGDHSK